MRLDFRVVIVDDELDDPDNSRSILEYKRIIEDRLVLKGFIPNVETYKSADEVNSLAESKKRRIDLYISDNNLGENGSDQEIKEGIDLYFHLKENFQCDFLLYTRSNKDSIIQKLIEDLTSKKDPNLFTKFSFVSRASKNEWHAFTYELLNHIVKRREEINNLRGLFAEKISRLQNHLKNQNGYNEEVDVDFSVILQESLKNGIIDLNKWQRLTKLRIIRNALLHNDEVYDELSDKYKIKYYDLKFKGDGTQYDKEEKLVRRAIY
ncbi:hypothetical protein [Acinetobacter guillouiae]|uniref:hypothetical protein n=1 Tax=Acinetobacter guillouiae TaxID=106649 RepID=UPI002FD8D41A